MKQNIFIIYMTTPGKTNGVDRHISNLCQELISFPEINLHTVELIPGNSLIMHQKKKLKNLTQIRIPLPTQNKEVAEHLYWIQKYNQTLYDLISPLFRYKNQIIVHIHTLNLIDLAIEIKKRTNAIIITHLHCICWKYLFNDQRYIFNQLYDAYFLKKNYSQNYYISQYEERAYSACDKIITCSISGKEFLQNVAGLSEQKIEVVVNGCRDHYRPKALRPFQKPATTTILFVGTIIETKGIFSILEALRLTIKAGYSISFLIAGSGPKKNLDRIKSHYSDISLQFLGNLPFKKLQKYYTSSHIGIIGSLQEQCSYTAIEMAMFGLPVVSTAIDGLDEIFTDGLNALKVPVRFNLIDGLTVDTVEMSNQVIRLIENPDLRESLSQNIRQLFQQKFSNQHMANHIRSIYHSMF